VRPAPALPVEDLSARFLRAISERVPADRVLELFLFPPLRQGQLESAVAVVAVGPERPVPDGDGATQGPPVPGEPEVSERSAGDQRPASPDSVHRVAVYTATYRYVRKGPERGAITFDLVLEAEAPLDAVAAVVRGVQRRAGDGVEGEAERMTGGAFRERVPAATPGEDGRVAAASGSSAGSVSSRGVA